MNDKQRAEFIKRIQQLSEDYQPVIKKHARLMAIITAAGYGDFTQYPLKKNNKALGYMFCQKEVGGAIVVEGGDIGIMMKFKNEFNVATRKIGIQYAVNVYSNDLETTLRPEQVHMEQGDVDTLIVRAYEMLDVLKALVVSTLN